MGTHVTGKNLIIEFLIGVFRGHDWWMYMVRFVFKIFFSFSNESLQDRISKAFWSIGGSIKKSGVHETRRVYKCGYVSSCLHNLFDLHSGTMLPLNEMLRLLCLWREGRIHVEIPSSGKVRKFSVWQRLSGKVGNTNVYVTLVQKKLDWNQIP